MTWSCFALSPGFSSFIVFCCLLDNIGVFGHSIWICFFYFFLFTKRVGWKCSPCKCIFEVKGCPSIFWDLLLVFCLETFFVLFILSFANLLTPVCFFQHNFHVGFWASLVPKLFGLPIGPLGALSCFFPHFSWGDWLHFHKTHYTNNLFGELGTCCTYQHH